MCCGVIVVALTGLLLLNFIGTSYRGVRTIEWLAPPPAKVRANHGNISQFFTMPDGIMVSAMWFPSFGYDGLIVPTRTTATQFFSVATSAPEEPEAVTNQRRAWAHAELTRWAQIHQPASIIDPRLATQPFATTYRPYPPGIAMFASLLACILAIATSVVVVLWSLRRGRPRSAQQTAARAGSS